MPLIQGQDVSRTVTLGKDDERRIRQTETEVRVSVEHHGGGGDVGAGERFELVCAPRDLLEEGAGDPPRYSCR